MILINHIEAQKNDPNQGLRAHWLRGTWGINWKPVNLYNGGHEGLSIEPFLNQISHIKTIDYIQVHLGESSIKSSVHMGPHSLLESFWEGDTDANGDPINLVVPRASYGEDPFLEIVKAIRAAGLKVMVYVNSSNMLSREGPGGSNPDYIPNITERWKEWCDTNAEAQAFIASQPYHTGVWDETSKTYINSETEFPERKYMFCYAEFVLKEYAIRYGDLLDAWCFDSGSWMGMNGDSQTNGIYEDQMIFNAFKAACHAGNPDAALSFQNSPERDTEELNPFSEAVHADDFMFGHPYNGGRDGGSHTIGTPSLYSRNYAHIEKMKETNGYAHRGSDPQTWTWDDNVVAHYDPPMSTTSWNGGNTPALTDEEFNLWNLEAVQNGGAISWGLPLVKKSGTNEQLVGTDWALAQLNGMDAHLMELEAPGAPNWSRQETVLSEAKIGEVYHHVLEEGKDFWDPENIGAISLSLSGDNVPTWITLEQTEPGIWTLSGTSTDTKATTYVFDIVAQDTDGSNTRTVSLEVANDTKEEEMSVVIKAVANTNYGVDQTAIMYSDVLTALDGKATFKISVNVTPQIGKAISSGVSGGLTTTQSWGLSGDEREGSKENMFYGEKVDWVTISDIQIIEFNANGGTLQESDFENITFKSLMIVNGQTLGKDAIAFTINEETIELGNLDSNPFSIELQDKNQTSFSIGIGNSVDQSSNKWSVEEIILSIDLSEMLSVEKVEKESVVLWPNPTSGIVHFDEINPQFIQVYDFNGRLLKSEVSSANYLDVSEFNNGVYIFKFRLNNGEVIHKKVIKKN
ncbi:glycoside hydrolase family 107 [Wenyingzhuangia fucanilytica]|uniref:Glycoside hydrolase family 107 n=1 Tax=Wenyingzhuangia fucanilytica TaxID=1790137 RepID=A0A1B1Y5S9_9FLAO|nr:T9SS type A sorting domain-containing protein [Wenyingzhuangia fucanilytica]ANW96097.1 glycoside hydrolase family 107 [Wenyingzhuangia fucanilytica]